MKYTHVATHRITGSQVEVYLNEDTGNYHESKGVILKFDGTPWILERIECDGKPNSTSDELNAIKSKCLINLIQHLNDHSQAWLKHDGYIWWTENEILSVANKIAKGEI